VSNWGWTSVRTYARDLVLFGVGIAIILKQAGILFDPPSTGPSLELLGIGALFCNGPLFLSYVSLRRGTNTPLPPEHRSAPVSPSAPPSVSSSGGDG